MILRNLTPASKTFILSGPVAAGVDGAFVDLTEVDMQGFSGIRYLIHVGTIAASGVITTRVKGSNTSGSYGAGTIDRYGTDLANNADTDDDKLIIHEITEARERYSRLSYQRTAGNVTINSVIVELFNPAHAPVAQAAAQVEASQVLSGPTKSTT